MNSSLSRLVHVEFFAETWQGFKAVGQITINLDKSDDLDPGDRDELMVLVNKNEPDYRMVLDLKAKLEIQQLTLDEQGWDRVMRSKTVTLHRYETEEAKQASEELSLEVVFDGYR